MLEVLLVTLVAELDHTAHLSVHVGVDLGLGGAVDTSVDLGNLMLHSGGKLEETSFELGLRGSNLGLGLIASSLDVLHSLGIAVSLEGLLGVEGSLETHGGLLELHVD